MGEPPDAIETITPDTLDRARVAVKRYTMEDIPSLEEIRAKGDRESLAPVDHLVLKMEYEAQRLEGE
mgnify:CR=1 FL=1